MFVKTEQQARQKLAELMKIERFRRKISQEKLAELADISRNYVSDIERVKGNPSFDILCKIATILDLDMNAILK